MTRNRLLWFVVLFGLVTAFGGCKKADPPPQGQPVPEQTPPPGNTDLYQLDPTKHVVPNSPATGKLASKTFTPDRVEIEGNRIEFRQGKDFFPDASITMFVGTKKLEEGAKITVRPDQQWGVDVPMLHVSTRQGQDLPDTKFVNDGYALTLEIEKVEKGKCKGKIYLCLPGTDKSYLAGTFVAERKRGLSDPPGDDEVPFVQGTVSVSPAIKKDEMVNVGYVGLAPDGQVISDGVGFPVYDDGSGGARSLSFKPRTAGMRIEKFVPRYDFTNLPPGRYLVYARTPTATGWAWVEVKPDSKAKLDLTLDAAKCGAVEVKAPAGAKLNDVRLIPADLGSPAPPEGFRNLLAFSLGLRADLKDGMATITGIPAGKYVVTTFGYRAEVDVTAGKTATVELKPEKK